MGPKLSVIITNSDGSVFYPANNECALACALDTLSYLSTNTTAYNSYLVNDHNLIEFLICPQFTLPGTACGFGTLAADNCWHYWGGYVSPPQPLYPVPVNLDCLLDQSGEYVFIAQTWNDDTLNGIPDGPTGAQSDTTCINFQAADNLTSFSVSISPEAPYCTGSPITFSIPAYIANAAESIQWGVIEPGETIETLYPCSAMSCTTFILNPTMGGVYTINVYVNYNGLNCASFAIETVQVVITDPCCLLQTPTDSIGTACCMLANANNYYTQANGSPDFTATTSQTWQPLGTGNHPFAGFEGTAANPIRINGTITITLPAINLTMSNLYIEFGPNGRILVPPRTNLILQGCTLTGDPFCGTMWQGIRTFGNNSGQYGSVLCQNAPSIISDAIIGISTQNLPIYDLTNISATLIGIPDYNQVTNLTNLLFTDLWNLGVINTANGHLNIAYVQFINCFMGINTAWKPSHNDVISNCSFITNASGLLYPFKDIVNHGEAGIFSMFSEKLQPNYCTFNNLKYGIRANVVADLQIPAILSSGALQPNNFLNCDIGISSRNFTATAFPNVQINDNKFTNCATAIQCQGSNATVFNNIINDGAGLSSVGILMMGSAYQIARNNQITNVSRGIVSVDTDMFGGFIHGNTITNSQVAIPNIGDNTSVTIMCNTLNNYQLSAISVAPWLTTTQTGILGNQGDCNLFVTALNTFTQPAGGPLFPDLYLYPTNTNLYTYSEYAQMLPPGFTASPGVLNLCNAGGQPPATWNPVDICNQFTPQRIANPGDVKNLIDEREKEIQTSLWVQYYAEQGDTAALTAFLAELNNRVALRYRIQQHLQEASATAILSLLDALSSEREEDDNYKYFYSLLLNLRETARTLFEITAEEETQLLAIANSHTATAYKAQALLFVARGYEFAVNLPELDLDWQTTFKAQPHATALQDAVTIVSDFYPNPASHTVQLNYNLPANANTSIQATIQLCNILGKPVFTTTLSGSGVYTLPLENFAEGLYYYAIVQASNHQVLKEGKLLISK